MPLDERVSIIRKFNDPTNMDFNVVIANPFSVSESISLHKGCRNAIYLERDYNCAMFLQSRDRIHRVGLSKDQKPNFYYVLSNNSVDEVIDNRLQEKIALMENLINDDIPLFSRLDDTDETVIIDGLLDQYYMSINDKKSSIPVKSLTPFSDKFKDVIFLSFEQTKDKDIAKFLSIDYWTTIVVYKDNKELSRTIGQTDKEKIYSQINSL